MRIRKITAGIVILNIVFLSGQIAYAASLSDTLKQTAVRAVSYVSPTYSQKLNNTNLTQTFKSGVGSVVGTFAGSSAARVVSTGTWRNALSVSGAMTAGKVIASSAIGAGLGRGIGGAIYNTNLRQSASGVYSNSIAPRINTLNQHLGSMKTMAMQTLSNPTIRTGLSLGPLAPGYFAVKAAGISPTAMYNKGMSLAMGTASQAKNFLIAKNFNSSAAGTILSAVNKYTSSQNLSKYSNFLSTNFNNSIAGSAYQNLNKYISPNNNKRPSPGVGGFASLSTSSMKIERKVVPLNTTSLANNNTVSAR